LTQGHRKGIFGHPTSGGLIPYTVFHGLDIASSYELMKLGAQNLELLNISKSKILTDKPTRGNAGSIQTEDHPLELVLKNQSVPLREDYKVVHLLR